MLFLVNLVDYGLLIFEFSLGLEHEYPHGKAPCAVYQTVSKGNPIVQAIVILLLVFYAANQYANQKSRDCGGSVIGQKLSTPALVGLFLSGLMVIYGLLALPTAAFAKIVIVEGKRYCEIEVGQGQKEISVYYLIYSAILSYWLPLLVSKNCFFSIYITYLQKRKTVKFQYLFLLSRKKNCEKFVLDNHSFLIF